MKGAKAASPSMLAQLTAQEKAELLDRLLATYPQMRAQVETLAVERLASDDQARTAEDVESALRCLLIDELNGRAGYQPGRGYVHECEAADELLDESLRHGGSETLLEYSPDFPAERAVDVVGRCRRRGIVLPMAELLDLTPDWTSTLSRS